jgi:hypothetical protein
MKTRNQYRIIVGILMTISGLLAILITGGEAIIGLILLSAGIAFIATGIIRERRYGDEPESDERSKKIGAYGLSYAWLTGLFFMNTLFWLDYLDIFRMSAQNALAVSIVFLALSAKVFQMWLFRKGDIS